MKNEKMYRRQQKEKNKYKVDSKKGLQVTSKKTKLVQKERENQMMKKRENRRKKQRKENLTKRNLYYYENSMIISLKEKGITLIALVITIIVLLILAGVTIATLMGDNRDYNKSTEGKGRYRRSRRR